MFFASDNSGPVPQQVLDALASANTGYQSSYGADTIMDEVRDQIRDIFEAPEAAVYLVATGTAANALALATMCEPFDTVFCSPVAHIHEDECNAPEFYTSGAKLTLVPGDDRMVPQALRAASHSSCRSDFRARRIFFNHCSKDFPAAAANAPEAPSSVGDTLRPTR